MAEADPYIGQFVADKYRVDALIGVGGMGRVYRCLQTNLDRQVCLKIMHKDYAEDKAQVARFHLEARSASKLSHPNIIQVYDFGQLADGSFYIAMEYLDGRDLAHVIHEEFPLGPERCVHILIQICTALAEAHAHKIVHRDLKPENIMLVEVRAQKDIVKVLDFGIAKVQDGRTSAQQPGERLTQMGLVCGTPEYMSPEQARGEDLDSRSDLYALGVVFYEMLTGKLPFDAASPVEFVSKHLTEIPQLPSRKNPVAPIPKALEDLCMMLLKKDRNDRPDNAMDLKARLDEYTKTKAGIQDSMMAPLEGLDLGGHFEGFGGSPLGGAAPVSLGGVYDSSPAPRPSPPAPSAGLYGVAAVDDSPASSNRPSPAGAFMPKERDLNLDLDTVALHQTRKPAHTAPPVTNADSKPRQQTAVRKPPARKSGNNTWIIVGAGVLVAGGIAMFMAPAELPHEQGTAPSEDEVLRNVLGDPNELRVTKDPKEGKEGKAETDTADPADKKKKKPAVLTAQGASGNPGQAPAGKKKGDGTEETTTTGDDEEIIDDPESPAGASDASATALVKEGNELVVKKEYTKAIYKYRMALSKNNKEAMAHRGLGIAFAALGNSKRAVKHYKDYIALKPDAPDAEQVKKFLKDWYNQKN